MHRLSPSRRRTGYTFLEVSVAFTLLGVGLAGLCPLVVMQVRLSKKIEQGFNPQTAYFKPGTTFYLVPSADAWERKLGVAATVASSGSSGSGGSSSPSPSYVVKVVAPIEKGLGTDAVTVHVSVVSSGGM
jgi:hypothetical protein